MFKKILIANRGEIALRIICACKELGIKAVAVYSEPDRNSLHVRFADEALCIGPARAAESYLHIPAVISAAEIANVDAIHPGYGLLSENANFAHVCETSGLKFIGPPPEIIRMMGEKDKARQAMKRCGVPILPGSDGVIGSEEEAVEWARQVGFPVIVKASAGGGGRGMRVIRSVEELPHMFNAAHSEAASAFGNGDLYMEKFIECPRHIEFQILADEHGNVVSLGERDCSIQRRHQKLVEESPSPSVSPELRKKMNAILEKTMKEIGYVNAGTVEFLMDEDGNLHFIEMNTRIQVEHPVTEFVTDVDLVKSQILIAAGAKLTDIVQTSDCSARPLHRVPHQRRASREVHAVGRQDHGIQRARWRRGSGGYGAVSGRRSASLLRFADRKVDCSRQGSPGGAGPHEARPGYVYRGRHPHLDSTAQAHSAGAGFHRRKNRYEVHGSIHAEEVAQQKRQRAVPHRPFSNKASRGVCGQR